MICYVCEMQQVNRMDFNKATSLGVSKEQLGILFSYSFFYNNIDINLFEAMLREGKTVVSETTGKDVSPKDCFSDSNDVPVCSILLLIICISIQTHFHSKSFLVIHCPSMEYLPLVIHNDVFKQHFGGVEFVIHITHHDVLMTSEYQKWMHKFHTIKVCLLLFFLPSLSLSLFFF